MRLSVFRQGSVARAASIASGLCLALAVSAGCDGTQFGSTEGGGANTGLVKQDLPASTQSLLERMESAVLSVPLDGVRRVELFGAESASGAVSGEALAHRERLQVGANGFRLTTEEVLQPGALSPTKYLALQGPRAGFYARYRDARVRDVSLVAANYQVAERPNPVTVAGRTCVQLDFVALHAPGHALSFAVDAETGVVLDQAEFTAEGQLLSRVRFESITFGEPASFTPQLPLNAEQPMEAAALEQSLGHGLLVPRLLPDGYRAVDLARVEVEGEAWSKATYTDGVEALFFLHRRADPTVGTAVTGRPGAPSVILGGADDNTPPGLDDRASEWTHFELGSLNCMWGGFDGFERIAVGRASLDDLQELLESTF